MPEKKYPGFGLVKKKYLAFIYRQKNNLALPELKKKWFHLN